MGILDLGRYKGIVFAITGFLVFIAIILAMNHAMVGRFADDTAGIKFLSQAQTQPKAIHDSAVLIAQLKHAAGPQPLAPEEAKLKSRIMQRILVNDAEIRQLAEPWLEDLEQILAGRPTTLH